MVHMIEDIYPLDAEIYDYIDYAALREALRRTVARYQCD